MAKLLLRQSRKSTVLLVLVQASQLPGCPANADAMVELIQCD